MKSKKKTVTSQKRKTKRKKKPYFGKEAHNAIVDYQQNNCRNEKNKFMKKELNLHLRS